MKELLALLLFTAPAFAEVVTYKADGVIDYSAWSEIDVGTPFSYEITVDDSTQSDDLPRYSAVSDFKFTVGHVNEFVRRAEVYVGSGLRSGIFHAGAIAHFAFVSGEEFQNNSLENARDLDTKSWIIKHFSMTVHDPVRGIVDIGGGVRTLARKWANGWGIGREPSAPIVDLPGLPQFDRDGNVC
jgi:hypothetical protein